MRIGIRPINDFAYKKIFSSPENKLVLISLLNAILSFVPIVDVTIVNPYYLLNRSQSIVSLRIFARRVCGLIPSNWAAPRLPSTWPFVAANARSM